MSYQANNPNGQATMANSSPVTVASNQSAIPVSGTFWQATQPVSGTFWQTTQPVSIATMPSTPVTGTFWQATQPVSLASVPSHAVTNAGTFAVQAAQSGTWTVGLSASQTLGTVTNLAQLGGTAVSMNTGVRDAGTQRVTIATNDTVPVTGTIELGATSLAALENISVTVPGTVDLGTVSLTALETITVTQSTASNFLNKPYGAVTTSAPTYTTGTDNALSLTTTGSLRVDGSGVTQPVSLASVPSHPVTNAGTFAVQVTSAPTTAVTGTFWQATQPVSIASMPSTPVTGTFWQATQPVSIATLPALAAGSNAIGKLSANAGVIIGAVELAPAITNTLTNATTTAYATSLVIKASAGTLYSINGYNSKTSTQFIQIHDSATLPADTAVPKIIFAVPASSNFSLDLSAYGRSFTAGIVVCNSSTGPTKTIGAADCWFDALYK